MQDEDRRTVSLDNELKSLLLCYPHEEVDFYKEIVNNSDVYNTENMVTYTIIKKEGSDG